MLNGDFQVLKNYILLVAIANSSKENYSDCFL